MINCAFTFAQSISAPTTNHSGFVLCVAYIVSVMWYMCHKLASAKILPNIWLTQVIKFFFFMILMYVSEKLIWFHFEMDATCALLQAVHIFRTWEIIHKIHIPLKFLFKFWWINLIFLNVKPVQLFWPGLCYYSDIYIPINSYFKIKLYQFFLKKPCISTVKLLKCIYIMHIISLFYH